MKSSIFFGFAFLSLIMCCTSNCVLANGEQSTNSTSSCDTSPIAVIFEHHYKGHPYRNFNIWRSDSDLAPTSLQYEVGQKSDYTIESYAGKGKFAEVYKGTHIPTGDLIAVKVLRKSDEVRTLNEIKLLMDLKDAPNFIPIRDFLKEYERGRSAPILALVFDYFKVEKPYRELFQELEAYHIKYFLYETLRSLDYVHSKGILHKDVKPLNVLMDPDNMKVKLIDFGHSEYYLPGQQRSTRVASLHYKGPELLLNYTMYDYALDIWSTGSMFAEMMFKKVHFFNSAVSYSKQPTPEEDLKAKFEQFKGQLEAIAEVLGSTPLRQYANKYKDWVNLSMLDLVQDHKKQPWTNFVNEDNEHLYDPVGTDLLDKMLIYDHERRITAKEALQHPYFDEVREKLAMEAMEKEYL